MNFKEKIEQDFLPFVIKPGRYIGNEWGAIKKDPPAKFKLALAFPDIYDYGVSDSNLNFWYYLINQNPNCQAERVFLPAKDAEKRLRDEKISLFSMESFTPLEEFDLILFGLRDQLAFTSVLNMLDLAQIPIYANERLEEFPKVGSFGKSTLNPEPMVDFFDFFILGNDAENIKEILIKFERFKKENISKEDLLVGLGQIESVYVPSLYQVENCNKAPKPKSKKFPYPISVKMSEIGSLKTEKRIVPLVETERESVEIDLSDLDFASKNEKSINDIIKAIQAGLDNTGEDEVRIRVGFDYQNFPGLVKTLWEKFGSQRASFFFSDVNPVHFTPEVIKILAEQKRNNISFATLGISDRPRNFLNQNLSTSKLLETIENIHQFQFRSLKLSFFLGVPNEDKEDLEELEKFLQEMNEIQRKGKNNINLTVNFKIFVSLPHTPWQWDRLEDLENLRDKISQLKLNLNFRNIKFIFPDLEKAYLKGILARGDRKLGAVIHRAWQEELKSVSEENTFDFSIWKKAFQENSLKLDDNSKPKSFEENLAWEHIYLIDKEKLKQERLKATERMNIPLETCVPRVPQTVENLKSDEEDLYGRKRKIVQKKTTTSLVKSKLRFRWSKNLEMRFTSHLDVIRTFDKAFRRARIPIEYSLGFHPHQRVSFGPPLPIGFISEAEYLDMQLQTPFREEILAKLNSNLPAGLRFQEARTILGKTVSLSESINLAGYEVVLPHASEQIQDKIESILEKKSLVVTRVKKDSSKQELDIRPFILSLESEKMDQEQSLLRMLLVLTPLGYARPQEILHYGLGLEEKEILRLLIKRNGLYCRKEEKLLTPLELVY